MNNLEKIITVWKGPTQLKLFHELFSETDHVQNRCFNIPPVNPTQYINIFVGALFHRAG